MWMKQVDSNRPAPKHRKTDKTRSIRFRRRLTPDALPSALSWSPLRPHLSSLRYTFKGTSPAASLSTAKRIAAQILLTSNMVMMI